MATSSAELPTGNYTKEEEKLLDTRRKIEGERPTYYDADVEGEIEITPTFESFLILSSNDFKENALRWINETTKGESDSAIKDELLSLVIKNDVNAMMEVFIEIQEKVQKYIDFKNTMTNLKDSTAMEVGLMLDSLQFGMEEILYYFDKYEFMQKLLEALSRRSEEIVNTEKLKERQSWANPIIEYS